MLTMNCNMLVCLGSRNSGQRDVYVSLSRLESLFCIRVVQFKVLHWSCNKLKDFLICMPFQSYLGIGNLYNCCEEKVLILPFCVQGNSSDLEKSHTSSKEGSKGSRNEVSWPSIFMSSWSICSILWNSGLGIQFISWWFEWSVSNYTL